MDIVLVSNFLNHHQVPLCEAIQTNCDSFSFIATEYGESQGYQESVFADYLIDYKKISREAKQRIMEADAVIFGGCPDELIDIRMQANKLSYLYSERFFKKGTWRRWIPSTRKKINHRIAGYKEKNIYVLCASAYLPYDLSLMGFPVEKCLKWGYFPQIAEFETSDIARNEHQIIWAGRMLDWKHPEIAVRVAEKLSCANVSFSMKMVGEGPEYKNIQKQITKKSLSDRVEMLGSVSHEDLMQLMRQSGVVLATSDMREGWGAIINEAMLNGCVTIASHAMGAVPYLIRDTENGFIFPSGDADCAYRDVKTVFDFPNKREAVSIQAQHFISQAWNAEEAGKRLVNLISEHTHHIPNTPYSEGPLSPAFIIKNHWFRVKK